MPIIYTYPSATPASGDYLLISDVSETTPANATRKCTVGDIVNLVTALVPGGGTVTSVAFSTGSTGLSVTGSPITTAGTLSLAGTLVAANGGTGIASYATGDILYASGATTLVKLPVGSNTEVLTLVGGVPEWAAPTTGTMIDWTLAGSSGTPQTISNGNTATIAVSGGALTSVAAATNTVTIELPAYTGTTNVGYVPTGGSASTFLTGAGNWVAGETYDLNATTSGADVNVNLTSTSGTDNSVVKLTAGTNITLTRLSGVEVQIDAVSPSSGIYGGSGSLSGATVVTTGVNDLTFTATTGDVIFNNNVAPNPVMIIDGATNTIGMGGNANLTDQLTIYNQAGSGNTTSLGIQGSNTTGSQKGMDIDVSGAATTNTALQLVAEGAGTNYALVTGGGNNGLGTVTPEGILHTADATATNILQRTVNDATGTNLYIRKARGTMGGEANVVTADNVGTISFRPYYGDFDNTAVTITAEVEGTLADDTTPGKLLFGTTAAGANTTTTAMVIDSAQNVGIGTTSPVASALVEVNSTTQGFLPPVMTTAQKNAISTPAEGLIVYDVTLHKLCVRVAAAWETITSA